MASRRGYTAYNKSVLMKGLTAHVKNVVTPELVNVLKRVAQQIVTAIDMGNYIPEYTGNLHDATGVAVYADGAVVWFQPTSKHATKKAKSGFGGVNHYEIDGNEFLTRTVAEASATFAKGVWFVVFSTVPYAYYIDANGSPLGRGQGFFNKTWKDAVNEILAGLRPIDPSITTSTGTTL